MIEQALSYAKKGWKLFPCAPNGKIPLTQNGFKDSTLDRRLITNWFETSPHANIGLVTGPESGFFVLDIDAKSGGLESLEKLIEIHGDIDTYMVQTGSGGIHFYFKYPEKGIRNKVNLLPGIDVRGDGGYVIAPPSKLIAGDYSLVKDTPLAYPPEWLLELLTEPVRPLREDNREGNDIPEGGRNDYLARLAGSLQRKGLSPESVSQVLHLENEQKCNPPLPSKEVDRIVESITRYEPEDPIEPRVIYIKASDLGDAMVEYLMDKDKVKGTPTGIPGLDKLLGGGKRLGELTAWHAEAKTGKNTLWHKMMYTWLELGIPIGYASRELTPETEVLPNILSVHYQKNLWNMDSMPKDYKTVLGRWPLYFAPGYGHFDLKAMEEWVTALKSQGVEYFFFDHLHYMLEEPEDHKAASKLAKELKTLTKRLNVHIDLIIQPNKLMDGQKLSLNSIKGGSAIGQAIDNMITLERIRDQKNIVKLSLRAARHKLASLGELYMEYDPITTDLQETIVVEEELRQEPGYNGFLKGKIIT